MARGSKTSLAEDFMDVVALLPWWAGVAMAFAFYLGLHAMAQPTPIATIQPGQAGAFAVHSLIGALAGAFQYVVPLLCLLASVGSFLRRHKRESLVNTVTRSGTADALHGMSWREFEMLVGEAFRQQGYSVSESTAAGPDGGVDLVLRQGKEKFLVQCKKWKAAKVGVEIVRELYGVMTAEGATGGFVVTSGTFSADAKAFAQGRNVQLVDGPKLFGLLQQARNSLKTSAPAAQARPVATAPVAAPTVPVCPICESSMVRRTAKKGANAGAQFWGCSRYPECRGTR